MSRINCPCGHTITTAVPSKNHGSLVASELYDELTLVDDPLSIVIDKGSDFMRCEKCGSIWIQENGNQGRWYSPIT
jgi:hypothetical protein